VSQKTINFTSSQSVLGRIVREKFAGEELSGEELSGEELCGELIREELTVIRSTHY
jgi:hypothetical protein